MVLNMVDLSVLEKVEWTVCQTVCSSVASKVERTAAMMVLLLVVMMGAYSVSCSADLMAGRTVENKALKMAAEKEFSMDCTLVCSMVLLKAEIAVVWSAE